MSTVCLHFPRNKARSFTTPRGHHEADLARSRVVSAPRRDHEPYEHALESAGNAPSGIARHPSVSERGGRSVAPGIARHPSVSEGLPDTLQSANWVAGALLLEPFYHQHIAETCRSKDGCAERGSMYLRSMGVWKSLAGLVPVVWPDTGWKPAPGRARVSRLAHGREDFVRVNQIQPDDLALGVGNKPDAQVVPVFQIEPIIAVRDHLHRPGALLLE
jgi:hypothetical protein